MAQSKSLSMMASSNGFPQEVKCLHEPELFSQLTRQLERLNTLTEQRERAVEKQTQWITEYIDRTMPIKSHFWILLGSLSVLATFATVMEYIQRLVP